MAATLGLGHIPIIIDGQKDVRDFPKVGQSGPHALSVLIFHQEEGHGRPQQDDMGSWVLGEDLVLQKFLPESNVLGGRQSVSRLPRKWTGLFPTYVIC